MADEIQTRSVEELVALGGVKWARHGADVLASWVADMDLRPPEVATNAITNLIKTGDLGYNFAAADQLPEAFSRWQQRRHGWAPDPEQVRLFGSVLHAIDNILWLTTEPGDGIVLFTPIYPPFLKAVEGTGRRLIDVPLDPNGWRLDPQRLADAIDSTTKVILFCNPHNPTGRTFDAEECRAVAQIAIENDLLLISDEVWADIVHPEGQHLPMSHQFDKLSDLGDELRDRLVTLSSCSKTFNLAGLRSAVAHIESPLVTKQLDQLPAHLLGWANGPGAAANLACWDQGELWYQRLMAWLTERRDQLATRLAAEAPAVGFQLPESTYLAWLDFSAYDLGEDAGDWLLEHAGVAFNPGRDFGEHGHGFARMNLATSPEIVDLVLDRVLEALPDRS